MEKVDEKDMLAQDRADIVEILRIRFIDIPKETMEIITSIQKLEVLQRLVLVAANATDWSTFHEELEEGESSFRVLGDRFNPIGFNVQREDKKYGEKS